MTAPTDSPSTGTDETAPQTVTPKGVVFPLLAKVAVGLLVGLAASDYVVGQIDEDRDLRKEGLLIQSPELGWTNSPGFVWSDSKSRINSLGLRGHEIPDDAPADEVRVIGVGASRVFGSGVFEMNFLWPSVLEALLKSEEGSYRVLNGGVNGYSALQSARRAMQLAETCDPDLILLFIAPGAQMMLDPSGAGNWARAGDGLIPRDLAEAVPDMLEPAAFAMHTALLNSNLYTRYRAEVGGNNERPPELKRFVLEDEPPESELARDMLKRLREEITQLVAFGEERNIEVRAVVMLEPYQMEQRRWAKWLNAGASRNEGSPPPGTPRYEGVEVLEKMVSDLGCETWVIIDELERIGSDLELYTTDDRHWSKVGHRIMATKLYKNFKADGLVEKLTAKRAASPRK